MIVPNVTLYAGSRLFGNEGDVAMTELDSFPDPGELPVVDWISKDLIDVDAAYQRGEDTARAEKIARSFSWSKFGAIVVVPRDDRFAVIDGQHRAAAAKMHPLIDNLPAVIMPSVQGTAAEATSFIGLNAERKQVNGLELFHAKLAMGDEDVLTVAQVLDRAGVTVPRYASAKYEARQTIAVNVINAMIGRHGAMRARLYLEILANADCAPISCNQIKAVEHLMTDDEFAGWIEPGELTATIRTMGVLGDTEAKRFAATHGLPTWKGLANVYFQKARKRRTPAKEQPAAGPEPVPVKAKAASALVRPHIAQRAAQVVMRTITPHHLPTAGNVTASVMGDPEPGRSALDQRRSS